MNILELDSYRLSDAVKFNDSLNPRLWTDQETLRPEVRQQLLKIADDFAQSLGVTDLQLKDITISGSNAAYTYTPHSDIDLHLVVDLPEADISEVYRELFDAKKYQYNDMHNIRIGGYDVELYVQDANQPHYSQGIYSVLDNEWRQVPRRQKPKVDDISIKSKYETLKKHIEQAVASKDLAKIKAVIDKIKRLRQTGLEKHGEFGPENLAFKMLRTQGQIKKLHDARNAAKDQLLSLDERKKRKRKKAKKTWGYFGGYWYPGTAYAGQDHPAGAEGGDGGGDGGGESVREDSGQTDEQILQDFVKFVVAQLKLEDMPQVKLRKDPEWPKRHKTFGRYNNGTKILEVAWGNRHIMDVLRTVAHELTHQRQHEREDVPASAGETGSEYENEANARAGILMRDWARLHPEHFDAGQAQDLEEGWKQNVAAGILGTSMALGAAPARADIANMTPAQIQQSIKRAELAEKYMKVLIQRAKEDGQPIDTRMMNAIKAKASDMAIAQIQKQSGGQQQTQTQQNFSKQGSERMVSPNFDKFEESASGYIPTKKQARDPRFSMALTHDIRPGQVGKEANKLKLRTDKQGHPQIARANGLFENLYKEYQKFKAAEDYSPDEPPGPEFKPSMPAGTLRVDVSDMYDWYKLGQHISRMKGLGKHDFGAGPPSAIVSFGDEDTEHKFIDQIKATGLDVTDIDPADPKKRLGKKIKTDPTYNVNEFAPSPDRDDNDQGPDQIHQLANRWWNAADPRDQNRIADVIRTFGYEITQVESEDDAVQLTDIRGKQDPIFISADEFDPDLYEAEQNFAIVSQPIPGDKFKLTINNRPFVLTPGGFGKQHSQVFLDSFYLTDMKSGKTEFVDSWYNWPMAKAIADHLDQNHADALVRIGKADFAWHEKNNDWDSQPPRLQGIRRQTSVGIPVKDFVKSVDAVKRVTGQDRDLNEDVDLDEANEKRRRFLGALARGVGLGAVGIIGAKYGLKNKENDPDVIFAQRIPDDRDREKFMRLLKQREGYKSQQMVGDTTATAALVINNIAIKKYKKQMAEKYNLQDEIKEQTMAEDKQITWTKPNFDREYEEVEFQLKHGQGQIPKDVLDFYTKYFPNKQAWMKASRYGRPVVLQPDHGANIRNYTDNKQDLLQALSPTSHDPEGPAKAQRVNALFDRGGAIEMPIILQTSKGLWLIGGKTRLGTANILRDMPATVWVIDGRQTVTEGEGFDQEAGIGIDGKSFRFKIRDLVALADKYPVTKVNPSQFTGQISGREEDTTQSMARAQQADLKYPIIVVKRQNDQLWIADGTHRAHKAILNKLPSIGAKIIPIKDMAQFEVENLKEEDLDEVKMSPGALEKFATSPEAKGIRAGFEAELIFRDTQGESEELDPEPNYDADERAYSIQQVIDFFSNDEYGYGLSDRAQNRLMDDLDERYLEWRDEQMYAAWRDERDDLIRDHFLEEQPMAERVHAVLVDGMELSDEEADRIQVAGQKTAPRFNTSKEEQDYADQNPDYKIYLEAINDAETILDEEVESCIASEDGTYDSVLDDFRDNYAADDDSFFSDVGLRWMSDIANEFNLDWPVWDGGEQQNYGNRGWEDIGNSLQDAVDMPVVVSSDYHSTKRRPGQWIIEPDGSLDPDDKSEEAGLEIVSPPMPLLTAIEKLKQVVDWANDPNGGNAYTNSTTGLHMGVSLPSMKSEAVPDDIGIDYVKLILFMGDKYVQQQFGREANTYCASALDKLRQNIKGKRSDPAGVVDILRHGLTELAYRELQKGVGTSKYTSAHIQPGYIEFRSPGGDWLAKADEEIGVLENTMLRFARAMAIAGNPNAERQEYAKKLYKLVTEDNPEYADQLKLFSEFSAGTINKEQLKKQWAETVLQKELPSVGKEEYEVYRRDNGNSPDATVGTLYAKDYDDAYDQFLRQYGRDINNLDVRIKQPWFDVFDDTGKIVKTLRAKDIDKATERAQYEFGERWTDAWNIYRRPDDTPEPKASPRAQVAKRIATKPKTPTEYNYDIIDQRTLDLKAIDRFYAADDQEASRVFDQWLKMKNLPNDTANYGYRRSAKAADARRDSADLQRNLGVQDVEPNIAQNFEPQQSNWEIYQSDDPSRVVNTLIDATERQVQDWLRRQETQGMPPGFLSARRQTATESIDPVSGAGAVPPRSVIKKTNTTKKVQPVEPTMRPQAYRSAIGQAISQKDLENMTSQIQIARKLGDDVNENFADKKVSGKSRPGRVKRAGASCKGSVTDLRARAKKYGGEKGRMYHWCANMKSGRKK